MAHPNRRNFIQAAVALAGIPAYPAQRTFRIVDFGAVPGGAKMCTAEIQRAIDACAESGGGRVLVPAGQFLSGSIVLKNRVNLHLDEGAVLVGSPWFRDYAPRRARSRARYEQYLQTSLIFAQGADGISVSGAGMLDGNSRGPNDFIAPGREGQHRPGLIWFDECRNVLVRDITFTSSGFWTESYTRCRNVHVDAIKVKQSTFRNNDGCNIIDCENAIVENCNIDAADDAICLKGYTPAGCNNVVIRNNRVRSLSNGIKAGTDSSGGFENILIENNVVWQTGISGIALEMVDGGRLQNVIVRKITMDVVETPIFLKLGDRNRPIETDAGEIAPGTGSLRDVHISGIRAKVNRGERYGDRERAIHSYDAYASSITGFPGNYVERVYIEDVEIEILGGFPPGTEEDARRVVPEQSTKYPENHMFGVLPASAFYIRHAQDIHLRDVRITMRQPDARPAFILDDVHASTFDKVRTSAVSPVPQFRMEKNCTGIKVD